MNYKTLLTALGISLFSLLSCGRKMEYMGEKKLGDVSLNLYKKGDMLYAEEDGRYYSIIKEKVDDLDEYFSDDVWGKVVRYVGYDLKDAKTYAIFGPPFTMKDFEADSMKIKEGICKALEPYYGKVSPDSITLRIYTPTTTSERLRNDDTTDDPEDIKAVRELFFNPLFDAGIDNISAWKSENWMSTQKSLKGTTQETTMQMLLF